MTPTEPAPAHGDGGPAQPHDDFHNIGVEHETSDVNVRVDPELRPGSSRRWRSRARSSSGGCST